MHPIYIVIAVLLLWLYYTKKDISILAAFVVVVLATFMNKRKEGLFNKGGGDKGGDSGDGPNCSDYGFKEPDEFTSKNKDSKLKAAIDNIKKVAGTHWDYDDIMGNTKNEKKKKVLENVKAAMDSAGARYVEENGENDQEKANAFIMFCANAYGIVTGKTPDEKKNAKKAVEESDLDMVIEGGELVVASYNYVYSSDEVKDLTEEEQKLTGYIVCLFSQYLKIANALKAAE